MCRLDKGRPSGQWDDGGCLVVQWSSTQNPLDEYSAGFIPINYLRKDDPCTDPTPCDQSSKIIKFFCVWDGQGPGILFHDMCFVDEFNCQYKTNSNKSALVSRCHKTNERLTTLAISLQSLAIATCPQFNSQFWAGFVRGRFIQCIEESDIHVVLHLEPTKSVIDLISHGEMLEAVSGTQRALSSERVMDATIAVADTNITPALLQQLIQKTMAGELSDVLEGIIPHATYLLSHRQQQPNPGTLMCHFRTLPDEEKSPPVGFSLASQTKHRQGEVLFDLTQDSSSEDTRYHQYMSLNMCRESGLKYNHNTAIPICLENRDVSLHPLDCDESVEHIELGSGGEIPWIPQRKQVSCQQLDNIACNCRDNSSSPCDVTDPQIAITDTGARCCYLERPCLTSSVIEEAVFLCLLNGDCIAS
uniref:Uncharacterized protein n=1 Tax=Timema poppense TaxID=170557 RepID=A0A7R9H6R8_TIMPO|nr:unnamed protein product [Timema poppensis]